VITFTFGVPLPDSRGRDKTMEGPEFDEMLATHEALTSAVLRSGSVDSAVVRVRGDRHKRRPHAKSTLLGSCETVAGDRVMTPFGFPPQRTPLALSSQDNNVAVKKGCRRTKSSPKAAKPDRITGRPFTCDSLVLFFPDDPHVEEYDVVDELQEGGEAKVGSHVL
jgi:hypothetical protein